MHEESIEIIFCYWQLQTFLSVQATLSLPCCIIAIAYVLGLVIKKKKPKKCLAQMQLD